MNFGCVAYCERIVAFVGKQVVCEHNKDYFYNFTCGLKLVSKKKQLYSLSFYAKPLILHNWQVYLTIIFQRI